MRFHVRERCDLHNSNSSANEQPIAFFHSDRQNRDDLFVMVNGVKKRNEFLGPKRNSQVAPNAAGSSSGLRFLVPVCGHMGKLLPDRRNQTVTFNLDPVQMFVYLRRIADRVF
jgi:hypothetical protein